jgi:hypothetical protein
VSADEKGFWKEAILTFPEELQDGGVDGLATRSDGQILAIEHTVVEPRCFCPLMRASRSFFES